MGLCCTRSRLLVFVSVAMLAHLDQCSQRLKTLKRASRSIAKTGSFCVFVLSVFFSSVSGGSFFSFFEFSVGFGGPKGGNFWTFFVKKTVFS